MGTLRAALLPLKVKPHSPHTTRTRINYINRSILPVARLFQPPIFEASKLKVVHLGLDNDDELKLLLPRTYTLTHCDFTSILTLAISHTVNTSQLQGWYNRLQRDEVVAVWKKIKGKMSLHVHCHISGGHLVLDMFAKLRYYIFCKELPVVLKAFVYGDKGLFNKYPELHEALAWVYFHSNIPEFNKVQCWGPLNLAHDGPHPHTSNQHVDQNLLTSQTPCQYRCTCCFTPNDPNHPSLMDPQFDGMLGVFGKMY